MQEKNKEDFRRVTAIGIVQLSDDQTDHENSLLVITPRDAQRAENVEVRGDAALCLHNQGYP